MTAVDTVAKARRMSLIKWERVKAFSRDLFNEIDKACGFCKLGSFRAGGIDPDRCDKCGVDTRCDAIKDVSGNLEDRLGKMIDGTISFLEDMDVTEK